MAKFGMQEHNVYHNVPFHVEVYLDLYNIILSSLQGEKPPKTSDLSNYMYSECSCAYRGAG